MADAEHPGAPGDVTSNGFALHALNSIHQDYQRLEVTLREENRATRDAVTRAIITNGETMERVAARIDKMVRACMWTTMVIVVVALVALGALVNSRIVFDAAGVSVGAVTTAMDANGAEPVEALAYPTSDDPSWLLAVPADTGTTAVRVPAHERPTR